VTPYPFCVRPIAREQVGRRAFFIFILLLLRRIKKTIEFHAKKVVFVALLHIITGQFLLSTIGGEHVYIYIYQYSLVCQMEMITEDLMLPLLGDDALMYPMSDRTALLIDRVNASLDKRQKRKMKTEKKMVEILKDEDKFDALGCEILTPILAEDDQASSSSIMSGQLMGDAFIPIKQVTLCSTTVCGAPQYCQGKCQRCYKIDYQQRKSEMNIFELLVRSQPCIMPGCEGLRFCRGMCQKCYYSDYRYRKNKEHALCSMVDCQRRPTVGDICRHHHDQQRRENGDRKKKPGKPPKQGKKRNRDETPDALSNQPTMKKARTEIE
jgi:hypothetical protein